MLLLQERLWNGIESILRNAWDTIVGIVQNLIDDIKRFFSNFDWKGVGNSIVRGIADGISAGASWVIDAIMRLAREAWERIKGFFDAKSPSVKMAGLGEDLMKGLAIGISSNAKLPVNAIGGAGEKAFEKSQSIVNNWQLTINEAGNVVNPAQEFFILQALAGR